LRAAIVDAGALVALFDDADHAFEHYTAVVGDLLSRRFTLTTTWPCVTEASYLLAPNNHLALLEWLRTCAVLVQDFGVADVEVMQGWMVRYTERGKSIMDFADATLYWLAVERGTNIVLTVDHRDFSRYRLPDGGRFEPL
jgi:uncharacterized protein